MGKTTLYHPVSLPAIRGALSYKGFRVAKIKQHAMDLSRGAALYSAEITDFPQGMPSKDPEIIRAYFDSALPLECTCSSIRYIHGKYIATITSIVNDNGQMRFA